MSKSRECDLIKVKTFHRSDPIAQEADVGLPPSPDTLATNQIQRGLLPELSHQAEAVDIQLRSSHKSRIVPAIPSERSRSHPLFWGHIEQQRLQFRIRGPVIGICDEVFGF